MDGEADRAAQPPARPGRCRGGRATARPRATRGDGVRAPGRTVRRRTASSRAGSSAGSNDPSPSITATYSAVAASIPACTAAPYPSRASLTTRAPQARATSAVPSREPLSTTITAKPDGTSAQQRGQGPGLVVARQHQVAGGLDLHVVHARSSRRADRGGWAYGTLTSTALRRRSPRSAPSLSRVPAARSDRAPVDRAGGRAACCRAPRSSYPRSRTGRCTRACTRSGRSRRWRATSTLRVGPGTPVAVLARSRRRRGRAPRWPRGSPWRALLVTTYAVTVAWTLALAFVDGRSGLTHEIVEPQRVPAARRAGSTTSRRCCAGSWTGSRSARPAAGRPTSPGTRPARCCSSWAWWASAWAGAFASAADDHPRRLHDAGGRAGDPAAPGRRGRRATSRAVPGAGAGGDLGGGLGRRRCSPPWRPGGSRPWPPRPLRRRARVPGAGAWLGGLLLGCCLLLSYGLVAARAAGRSRCWWPARSWRPLPAVAVGALVPVLVFAGLRLPALGGLPGAARPLLGRDRRRPSGGVLDLG